MGLWSRIRRTFTGDQHQDEIREELQFHLAMDMADGRDGRDAHLRLGNTTRISEETRSVGIVQWLDSVLRDARYGLRQLGQNRALTFAVVLSLTIGIGANTAIFSLLDAALLRPLPVRDPGSLRVLVWTNDSFPDGVQNINGEFSAIAGNRVQGSSIGAKLYRTLARQQTKFESLTGVADADSVAVAVGSTPAEQVNLQYVSSNFFQALGVSLPLGRGFRADEDVVGREPVVVVSQRFWLRRLEGSSEALGKPVRINNVEARIVGVAPAGFFGMQVGEWNDFYAPLAARVAFDPNQFGGPHGENDQDWWVRQIARLKPGVSEAAATAEAAGIFRSLFQGGGKPLAPDKVPQLISQPGARGFQALDAKAASALWILMLLVGVLLVMVCANVATLLLSRSVARQRESAVRLALGAGRWRLFRQHLIESGMFAVLGGAAGLALGNVLARAIHLLFQAGQSASNVFDLDVDPRVLGYTAALSVLTAFLFGLAPAVRASQAALGDALKAQTRTIVGGRLSLPRMLVSVQIGLCLSALVAAGLLERSLLNLRMVDVGFDRQNLAYASINPWQAGYTEKRVNDYVERVRQRVAAIPGVTRVSPVGVRLLAGNGSMSRVQLPGRPVVIDKDWARATNITHINRFSYGAFETLGIQIVAGRAFEQRDIHTGSDAVVVDELFAKHFFPNQNPLGRRFSLGKKDDGRFQIVGVARDSRYNSLRENPVPTVYEAYLPGDLAGSSVHFAIRAGIDSAQLAVEVRKALAAVDPAVALTEFHTQSGLIDRLLRIERLLGFVSTAFGAIAIVLAAIGLGGLLAYAVARRTNEIGVRLALGADSGDVVRMVLGDSVRLVIFGILIGLPCAYAVGRVLQTMLFQLKPLDPWTAGLSLAGLISIGLLTAWLPARRAARIDPMVALREE